MFSKGVIPNHIESIKWQDYRGIRTGVIVYYNTDPISEIPIREVPEELPTELLPEPNYESGSYGLYGCKHNKMRSSFVKKKIQYLFFMTRYEGTNIELTDELMVTGYYRIKQVADVQKLHIRYLNEYSCLNEETCMAFRADKIHFVSVQDAFLITSEVLKVWESTSRITRQTKIVLDEEKTAELIAYLESKKNVVEAYIEETERLQPAYDDDEEEEDDENLFEDADEEDYDDEEDELEVTAENDDQGESQSVSEGEQTEVVSVTAESAQPVESFEMIHDDPPASPYEPTVLIEPSETAETTEPEESVDYKEAEGTAEPAEPEEVEVLAEPVDSAATVSPVENEETVQFSLDNDSTDNTQDSAENSGEEKMEENSSSF